MMKQQQSDKAAGIVKTYLKTEFFRDLCKNKKERNYLMLQYTVGLDFCFKSQNNVPEETAY